MKIKSSNKKEYEVIPNSDFIDYSSGFDIPCFTARDENGQEWTIQAQTIVEYTDDSGNWIKT